MTKTWDEVWQKYKGPRLSFDRLKQNQIKTCQRIVNQIGLAKNSKIIDVACGSGSTVAMFRHLGYFNSIGIDNSQAGLEVCHRLFNLEPGKDVLLMDARNIEFPDNSFDLVFSDGLLEHFENPPLDIVGEFCRISKKWVLLFQPNQTSLFGRVCWLWQKMGRATWEKEYPYSKSDYINMLAKFGFSLVDYDEFNLHGFMSLLFTK
jgi:ubiquinone/menaquinone biosynthesis C-methylase UbiE